MQKLFQTKKYSDRMVLCTHLLELRSQVNGNVIYLRKQFLRQKAHFLYLLAGHYSLHLYFENKQKIFLKKPKMLSDFSGLAKKHNEI